MNDREFWNPKNETLPRAPDRGVEPEQNLRDETHKTGERIPPTHT